MVNDFLRLTGTKKFVDLLQVRTNCAYKGHKGGLHREGPAHGRNVIIESAGDLLRDAFAPPTD